MSKLRWMRKLLPLLIFLNIRKMYRKRASLMKIEAAKIYVLGVKKIRFLLLGALFTLFSFVLLAGGLLLIHVALFAFSGWPIHVKFLMALLLGGLEIFAAGGFLFYLFSEKTWAKFSNIKHVLNSAVKK